MPRLSHYVRFSPYLFGAFFSYFLLTIFCFYVDPAVVANFILPHCYLPFSLLVLFANFCFFTFLSQSKFNGLVLALWLGTYLFFILQKVVLTPLFIFLFALPWLVLFLLRFLLLKRS
jgi:hypothetical protein